MSDSRRRYYQFLGLAIIVDTYIGGIIGWGRAVTGRRRQQTGTRGPTDWRGDRRVQRGRGHFA